MRLASCILLSACGAHDAAVPTEPVALALPDAVARLALTVDVSTAATSEGVARRVRALTPAPAAAPSRLGAPTSFASLLGVDGVVVEVGRVDRSILGRYVPGKVRIAVSLRLRNALDRTMLLTPTLPTPPAGDGVYLFAVQSVAVDTPGGVTGSGNRVLVESPSHGSVTPGPGWDGGPFDFLRGPSSNCAPSTATCAKWERFAAPIGAGRQSEWRTVNYDIDPTVHHMRLRFIVAADLANARP